MTPEALTKKQSHRADAVETSSCADISSTSNADETRRRLEFELAVVLARQPKHQGSPDPIDGNGNGPLEVPESARVTRGARGGALDTAIGDEPMVPEAGTDVTAGDQVGAPSLSGEARRKRWLRSTRRTTDAWSMGTVASFAITLLVTAFILSLVAVSLFGVPTSISGQDGAPGDTSAKQASQSAKGTKPSR